MSKVELEPNTCFIRFENPKMLNSIAIRKSLRFGDVLRSNVQECQRRSKVLP